MSSSLVWVSVTVLSPVLIPLFLVFVMSLTVLALTVYEWYQESR
jgi:hypothetical protein